MLKLKAQLSRQLYTWQSKIFLILPKNSASLISISSIYSSIKKFLHCIDLSILPPICNKTFCLRKSMEKFNPNGKTFLNK